MKTFNNNDKVNAIMFALSDVFGFIDSRVVEYYTSLNELDDYLSDDSFTDRSDFFLAVRNFIALD